MSPRHLQAQLVQFNFKTLPAAALRARIAAAVAVCFFGLVIATQADASILRQGMDAHTLPANDDGSTGPIDLGFEIDFFGAAASQVFVNNNGNITLHEGMRRYTPEPLSTIDVPIIAPFFSDVDTDNGIGGEVTFGQGRVAWRKAFAVNWIDVNYYGNSIHTDQLNTFQLVIIDRHETGAGNFDVEFNYDQIRWEATTSSGASPWGLGGRTARAGFSAGTHVAGSYVELEGSGVAGSFIDGGTHALSETSNIDMTGRFVFNVRDGVITVPPAVPLPAGMPLLLVGIATLTLAARRSRRHIPQT